MNMVKTVDLYGFPVGVSADAVKSFLERTIAVQGCVVALEIKQSRGGGPRVNARVQFTTTRIAEQIFNLANGISRLYYGQSYLKARFMEYDMIRTKVYEQQMGGIVLNFGCQVSTTKFLVLYKKDNVSVKFGIGLKKMYFLIDCGYAEYKLELAYENVWQIVLHRTRDHVADLLVIQLFGAPRIYKKLPGTTSSYFTETPDDQWARTTDFTSSSSIGQSSSICLQLPKDVKLPKFADYFPWYKETDNRFVLETGLPYSSNKALVPILSPSRIHMLPYEILFKICCMVQTGCLPGPKLNDDFFRLVDPRRIDIRYIEHSLENLYSLKECCYEPVVWLTEQYAKFRSLQIVPKSPTIAMNDGLVYVRRVQVTPCRVYFTGPEVNVSNRVLRNYPDDINNFLRVSFIDEEWNKLSAAHLQSCAFGAKKRTEIYDRVLSTLKNGIVIGDKKFDFLAFSSSQLRENSAWMFASRPGLTAADIRVWMGDFRTIKNVAKYAARLGQSFSSSTETLTVLKHEVDLIPDIVTQCASKYVFSDGIGKINAEFALRVAKKCGLSHFTPSAFQIRYGGYKGVVAVDPHPSFYKLSLRPSMRKFESDNNKLDVLLWTKYQPCFLNRQLITLLSTLGVADQVFVEKQRKAVEQLDKILTDPIKAHEALELMVPGENTNILKEMLKCGYKPDIEPFLTMMLQTFRATKLLDLRLKSRIFIPDGRSLMGCLDETGILEYGEVFVKVSNAGQRQFNEDSVSSYVGNMVTSTAIVTGRIIVAKNPCLHPGDIRVLKAVNAPSLHHMVDCVVFPQKGPRPHPNECSGSDLDGDIYFVCWDRDLTPRKQASAMDYTPSPTIELDHEVTIEEIEEYFTNYILNDSLGMIANAHTVFADREPKMAMSKPCLELAKLFSIAVDFPKTGVPAEIPPELRVKEYPDFMEKPDKPTYESHNVIGKLFREVKDIAPLTSNIRSFTKEVAIRSYDIDLLVEGYEDYIDEAFDYKTEYDYKLGNLMDYYGIKTEAEILSGGIMKMARSFDRRKDDEAVGASVRALRKECRTWFKRDTENDDLYAKASAWYHVTYHPEYWGLYNEGLNRDHYISFPWCIYDKLVQIKKEARRGAATTSSSVMDSLGRNFVRLRSG